MQRKMRLAALTGMSASVVMILAGTAIAAPQDARTFRVPGAEVTVGDRGFSITLPNGRTTTVAEADYTIGLRFAKFDPMQGTPDMPAALKTGGEGVYIVQFATQPLEGYLRQVEALGAKVHQYVAQYGYLMRLDGASLEAVSALPYVRWVGEYHPGYKLDGDLLLRDFGMDIPGARSNMVGFDTSREAGLRPHTVNVMVLESGPGMKASVIAKINALGGTVIDGGPESHLVSAELTAAQILELARMPEVQWIDPYGPGSHDMDLGRIACGADFVFSLGYNGAGVRAEICDTETLVSHQEFQVNPVIVHLAGNSGLHGTACMGNNFGTGVNSQARGFLPAGQGIFANSSSLLSGGAARYTHTAQLLQSPYFAVWQTNSTGSPQVSTYTSISASMDDMLFQHDVLHFQSQSNTNNQNSRPQAWAKNIVAVGGLNHFNNLNMNDDTWNGASIGYASDGRAKPDLANWYDQTFTAWGSSTTAYTNFSGTSNATPMTAGVTGLFYQMWHNGIFGNPTGATVFDSRPKMSLAKAMMINTANQWQFNTWSTGQAEPNRSRRKQGWGQPNAENVYNIRNACFWVNETEILQHAQTKTHRVRVANGSNLPFKATMVYIDPQGNPAIQTQHRINKLNMKVTDPSGTVYWGNFGLGNQLPTVWSGANPASEGMWSLAGGSANTKDTVENVFVQSPMAGVWTVEIIAAEIVQDAWPRPSPSGPVDASYSLVVTGATLANCPGDTNGDGVINFADLNTVLSQFGQSGPNLAGDVNFDGIVNFADLNIVLSNFGVVC